MKRLKNSKQILTLQVYFMRALFLCGGILLVIWWIGTMRTEGEKEKWAQKATEDDIKIVFSPAFARITTEYLRTPEVFFSEQIFETEFPLINQSAMIITESTDRKTGEKQISSFAIKNVDRALDLVFDTVPGFPPYLPGKWFRPFIAFHVFRSARQVALDVKVFAPNDDIYSGNEVTIDGLRGEYRDIAVMVFPLSRLTHVLDLLCERRHEISGCGKAMDEEIRLQMDEPLWLLVLGMALGTIGVSFSILATLMTVLPVHFRRAYIFAIERRKLLSFCLHIFFLAKEPSVFIQRWDEMAEAYEEDQRGQQEKMREQKRVRKHRLERLGQVFESIPGPIQVEVLALKSSIEAHLDCDDFEFQRSMQALKKFLPTKNGILNLSDEIDTSLRQEHREALLARLQQYREKVTQYREDPNAAVRKDANEALKRACEYGDEPKRPQKALYELEQFLRNAEEGGKK
jgi:hypothetical protein